MGWRGLRSLRDATRTSKLCEAQTLASNRPRDQKLASAIADCGFYEFKRQLSYKCEWYGSELVIAPRFYPSSQICSQCGHKQKMPLHKRTYKCERCGLETDRDFNVAVNERKLCA
ncbi:MAG: transposase [Okeania sp. SIO2F4]|uniref:zinc ribbon domain-containing protein n=1 Tax=Okeania sp. SIO2F4 TaxID=2607790 RepID=UPI00142B1AD3|nr:transposase [Okeania sp. SIO2F4]